MITSQRNDNRRCCFDGLLTKSIVRSNAAMLSAIAHQVFYHCTETVHMNRARGSMGIRLTWSFYWNIEQTNLLK